MNPSPSVVADRLTLLRSLHAASLLAAIVVVGLWSMDVLTDPESAAAPAGSVGASVAPDYPGEGRLFVLVIDSLRYETALDPSVMPHLASTMPERGAFAKVQTILDPVTVPALRAAFTGRDRFAIFGFVRNLWHREEGFSSLFSQLMEAGRCCAVFSDGSFRQFGEGRVLEGRTYQLGTERTEQRIQTEAMEEALRAFLSGRCDLVVGHVNYADHTAHRVGVGAEAYRRAFGDADALVERLDGAIASDASLLIVGDHGHDADGRHLMGMDVPTFLAVRGPGFRPGTDLGTIHIADLRYLAGWALKVPLPATYPSGRHPQALLAADIPAGYARSYDYLADRSRHGAGVVASRRSWFFLVILGLGVLGALWIELVRGPHPGLARRAGTWAATALVGSVAWGPAGPAAGAALGLAMLVRRVRASAVAAGGLAARREALWAFAPVTAVPALAAWGAILWMLRPWVHYPRYAHLIPALVLAVVAGTAAAVRFGAMRTAWVFFAAAGVLGYPTVYRYGAPGSMALVWGSCLIFILAEDLWSRRGGRRPRRAAPGDLLAVAALTLLVPFALTHAIAAQFNRWYGPVADVLWRGPQWLGLPVAGLALAVASKLVVFVPRAGGARARLGGLAIVAALEGLRLWAVTGDPGGPQRFVHVAAIGSLCAAAALTARGAATGRGFPPRVLGLGALYAAYLYTIRAGPEASLWLDCLLAAFALSARFLKADASFRQRCGAYPLLLLSGVWACGWVTLAWTFHRLEWGFLYDWLDAALVEARAGVFIALIVVRYAIPLVMVRMVLAAELGDLWPYPQRIIALLTGLKTLAALSMAVGMGFFLAGNDFYLEAVQETAIWAVLSAVLLMPARRPA
jgi:hypothetical protein